MIFQSGVNIIILSKEIHRKALSMLIENQYITLVAVADKD